MWDCGNEVYRSPNNTFSPYLVIKMGEVEGGIKRGWAHRREGDGERERLETGGRGRMNDGRRKRGDGRGTKEDG